MAPLVSVVMPVRNGGIYVSDAVSSVLGQTLQEIELILVDDHSDDQALHRLAADDPRQRILKNRGSGVSAAFNTGLAVARGSFIARMDADDLSLPRRLECQLKYLRRCPEVSICGARVEIFSADGIAPGNQRYQDWLNACCSPQAIHQQLFVESPIPNPSAFFRRQAIDLLGGYADPDWPEDYDLFLRADAAGLRMGKPAEILLKWRDHGQRLTRTDSRYGLKRFQAAKAHYLASNRLGSTRRIFIWGAGPSGRLSHDLLVAEGVAISGFLEVHPRRIGGEKRGLPVLHFEQAAKLNNTFVLVAVGAAGAREEIRDFMNSIGRVEAKDYLFIA